MFAALALSRFSGVLIGEFISGGKPSNNMEYGLTYRIKTKSVTLVTCLTISLHACGNGGELDDYDTSSVASQQIAGALAPEDLEPKPSSLLLQDGKGEFFCSVVKESRPEFASEECRFSGLEERLDIGISGRSRAEASLIGAEETYIFTVASGLRRLSRNDDGHLENASGLFSLSAEPGEYCLELNYRAPSPTADSIFIRYMGDDDISVPLPNTHERNGTYVIPQDIFKIRDGGAFALLPRERATIIESLRMVPC